jgi:hypothetical protein
MTMSEEKTLQMLEKIDQKLTMLIENLRGQRTANRSEIASASKTASLLRRADCIAVLTPKGVRQNGFRRTVAGGSTAVIVVVDASVAVISDVHSTVCAGGF